jgi:hypothetical protein
MPVFCPLQLARAGHPASVPRQPLTHPRCSHRGPTDPFKFPWKLTLPRHVRYHQQHDVALGGRRSSGGSCRRPPPRRGAPPCRGPASCTSAATISSTTPGTTRYAAPFPRGQNPAISAHPPRLPRPPYRRAQDTASPLTERDRLGLRGLLPPRVMTFKEQYERFSESSRRACLTLVTLCPPMLSDPRCSFMRRLLRCSELVQVAGEQHAGRAGLHRVSWPSGGSSTGCTTGTRHCTTG